MLIDDDGLASLDVFEDSVEEVDEQEEHKNNRCLFCKKKPKKYQGREQKLHTVVKSCTLDNLEQTASDLGQVDLENEIKLLRKTNNVAYHKICKNDYDNTLTLQHLSGGDKNEWHASREKQ